MDADGVVAGVDRVPGEGAHGRVHTAAGRADVHHLEESRHVRTVHNTSRHYITRDDSHTARFHPVFSAVGKGGFDLGEEIVQPDK